MARLLAEEVLDEEVESLAGERYSRKEDGNSFRRWGSNSGSIRIDGEKVPIDVPRVRDTDTEEERSLESYQAMKNAEVGPEPTKAILLGGGCDFQNSTPRTNGGTDSTIFVNSIGMEFRRIPAGAFEMGSSRGEDDEAPPHDVYGNVWEWVRDAYSPQYYARSEQQDPLNTGRGRSPRVIRGGGWFGVESSLRSANRGWARPGSRAPQLGFRVVREIPGDEQ